MVSCRTVVEWVTVVATAGAAIATPPTVSSDAAARNRTGRIGMPLSSARPVRILRSVVWKRNSGAGVTLPGRAWQYRADATWRGAARAWHATRRRLPADQRGRPAALAGRAHRGVRPRLG